MVMGGVAGVGGFYALGERVKALVTRRTYRAEHTAVVERTAELSGGKDA